MLCGIQRFLVDLGAEIVDHFFQQGLLAHHALHHIARRLAGAEAGNLVLLRQAARGLGQRGIDAFLRHLDGQQQLTVVTGFGCNVHFYLDLDVRDWMLDVGRWRLEVRYRTVRDAAL